MALEHLREVINFKSYFVGIFDSSRHCRCSSMAVTFIGLSISFTLWFYFLFVLLTVDCYNNVIFKGVSSQDTKYKYSCFSANEMKRRNKYRWIKETGQVIYPDSLSEIMLVEKKDTMNYSNIHSWIQCYWVFCPAR